MGDTTIPLLIFSMKKDPLVDAKVIYPEPSLISSRFLACKEKERKKEKEKEKERKRERERENMLVIDLSKPFCLFIVDKLAKCMSRDKN